MMIIMMVLCHTGLQYDNGDIKQCYSQKLRLIEPDSEELVVPDVEYSTVINLPNSGRYKYYSRYEWYIRSY